MVELYRPLLCVALFLLAFASLEAGDRSTIVSVAAYGAQPDSGEDATVPFQRAIAAAKSVGRPVTLVIPKGRYDFFSPHAIRRRCYLSNATEEGSDAMRTIALDFSDLNGITVEGSGARLVMRGKMTMLVAERSRNLSLHGLEFDFARPTVSEIVAVEKGAGYWVGRVHADSTYRLVGNRIEWFGEDWHAFHNLTQHYDPATQTTWRGGDPTSSATSVKEVGDRLLRFEVPNESLQEAVVGRTYQFRDVVRDQTGMWFSRCQNVAMDGVKIRAMAGFGVLFQFTDTVSLKHLEVGPTKESGRTCAAAADILHFSGCRGKIRVQDSVLTAAHDDAINIHGTHLRVVSTEGAQRIRVRFMHTQTWGFSAFVPGDEIDFVRKDTLLPYAQAKVVALEMTADPREQIITLDRPYPRALTLNSDAIENATWTPSVEVTGCQIGQVPTRGILVTTRRPVRISNNRFFRIPMPSILVEDDARGWYESGMVRDLLVRSNVFFECSGPVIQVNPQNGVFESAIHQNLWVEKNLFVRCALPLVSVRALDGLRLVANHIWPKNTTPVAESELAQAVQTTGVSVNKNVVETSTHP